MLKKLLVTLIASAFAITAFAQTPAPKNDGTSAPSSMSKGKKKSKGERKAKAKSSKGKAKSDQATSDTTKK
ncbi:MAG: hypothetical protein ABR570_12120 [Burkholderiales bacterium]